MSLRTLERSDLIGLNKSELLQIGWEKLGVHLSRALPESVLVDLVMEDDDLDEDDLCPTHRLRPRLEEWLHENVRFLSQIPNCNKKCTSWGCPALHVLVHFASASKYMV